HTWEGAASRRTHAIDRRGVREVYRVVRRLLHIQAAAGWPALERGVRASRRDDAHPAAHRAEDQMAGELRRPRRTDEVCRGRDHRSGLAAVIGPRLIGWAGGRRQRMAVPVTLWPLIAF